MATTVTPVPAPPRSEESPPATRRTLQFSAGTAGRVLILAIATFLTLGPAIWTSITPKPPGGGEAEVGLSAYRDVFDRVDYALLF